MVRGKQVGIISAPASFGGKEQYCAPEDMFAASLAACINTIFILIARNSKLALKSLQTNAKLKMKVEGLEKLIFTNLNFTMTISLEKDDEFERKKALTVFNMAQKICPIRQSWGEGVPISFELKYK